jgi:hypothetical protein
MDTKIYIACLRQVVSFAPKAIIIACLRQMVAFAPKVIIIVCLRQGFCIRKTRYSVIVKGQCQWTTILAHHAPSHLWQRACRPVLGLSTVTSQTDRQHCSRALCVSVVYF